MKISDFSLKEILKLMGIYLAWTCWAYGLLIYSISKVIKGKGLESFRLGNVPIPKFYNTSYIEMVIFVLILVIAVGVGFYIRYISYGEELHFRRMYNIKDDRRLSDDLMDNGSSDGSGGD